MPAGAPVSVTYCPLTGTVLGFERGETTFGVSGRLINNNLVVYDLGTEADTAATLEQDLRVDLHGAGDAVAKSDMEVTLNEVRTETKLDDFTEADEGNEFAVVDVSVTNETGEATPVSIALQMVTKDGAGWMYQVDVGAQAALDQAFEQGSELADGETRRGEIAYQVPEGTAPLYWVFEFDLLADGTKTFWQLR